MNEWMKEHTLCCILYKALHLHLRSTTQNMFSYLDFRRYFEANGQNHIHFWLIQVLKNRMAWDFLTFRSLSSKLEFVYPQWSCGVEEQMLIFSSRLTPGRVKGSLNPIPKLAIVLIWKTPLCLKFGKTSNSAVQNLPQRKLWVWAANDTCSKPRFWCHRTLASACFFGNDRSSHSRVRTQLLSKSVYYEWASDSFAYPCPCNNSWYACESPRVKKCRFIWIRLSGLLQVLKNNGKVQLGNPNGGRGRLRELFVTKVYHSSNRGFTKVVEIRADCLPEWSQGELRLYQLLLKQYVCKKKGKKTPVWYIVYWFTSITIEVLKPKINFRPPRLAIAILQATLL